MMSASRPASPVPLRLFLTVALIALGASVAALSASGCAASTAHPTGFTIPDVRPRVLVVVDSADAGSRATATQTRLALTAAHVGFAEARIGDDFRPGDYDAVLLTAERLGQLRPATAEALIDFVNAGGGLAHLLRGWSAEMAPLLGLPPDHPPFVSIENGEHRTLQALMPGEEGLVLPVEAGSMLDVPDPDGCTVLSRVGQLAGGWTCTRGAGRVVVWNQTRMVDKHFRGHILQTLALVQPTLVRPLANWAVVYIDDFPAPAPTARLEPVASEFDMDMADFYAHRWYPDMRALAAEFGVVYTSTVTFSYNGRTEAPFGFAEWLATRVEADGRTVPYAPWIAHEELAVSELALHGYNHQSLALANWPSSARMAEALGRARGRWEIDALGPLPTTYVPPMNWIDSVGTAALHQAMPEIRSVAGIYWGDDHAERGQNQEFGPDPWVPALYDFPRTTAGFDLHPMARLEMLSGLYTVGGWGHFVHPDEMLPNADREHTYAQAGLRSPSDLGWHGKDQDGLFYQLGAWLQVVRETFPWLEYVRADEGLRRQKSYDALLLHDITETAGGVRTTTVRASETGHDLLVTARLDERLDSVAGGEVRSEWDGPLFRQYVVRQTEGEVRLTFHSTPS